MTETTTTAVERLEALYQGAVTSLESARAAEEAARRERTAQALEEIAPCLEGAPTQVLDEYRACLAVARIGHHDGLTDQLSGKAWADWDGYMYPLVRWVAEHYPPAVAARQARAEEMRGLVDEALRTLGEGLTPADPSVGLMIDTSGAEGGFKWRGRTGCLRVARADDRDPETLVGRYHVPKEREEVGIAIAVAVAAAVRDPDDRRADALRGLLAERVREQDARDEAARTAKEARDAAHDAELREIGRAWFRGDIDPSARDDEALAGWEADAIRHGDPLEGVARFIFGSLPTLPDEWYQHTHPATKRAVERCSAAAYRSFNHATASVAPRVDVVVAALSALLGREVQVRITRPDLDLWCGGEEVAYIEGDEYSNIYVATVKVQIGTLGFQREIALV